MRRHRIRRYRFFRVGGFVALAISPLVLLWTRPKPGAATEVPGMVDVYASGLNSLGVAAYVALPLAVIFLLWLMAGERREVNRKYLNQGARDRVNFVAFLRTMSIILGAAGIIIGCLAGLYSGMIAARPELQYELPLPFFTFQIALYCLLGGGALYAVGRLGR
jgi:Na+/pantothenate symporter